MKTGQIKCIQTHRLSQQLILFHIFFLYISSLLGHLYWHHCFCQLIQPHWSSSTIFLLLTSNTTFDVSKLRFTETCSGFLFGSFSASADWMQRKTIFNISVPISVNAGNKPK